MKIARHSVRLAIVLACASVPGPTMRAEPFLNPTREAVLLNGTWEQGGAVPQYGGDKFEHKTYARRVEVPAGWAGKQVFVEFLRVNYAARVFINDQLVTEHVGGWVPFSVDATRFAQAGSSFALRLEVTSSTVAPYVDAQGKPLWPVGTCNHDGSYAGNLRNGFSPVALFDKAYDDLGIAPLMKKDVPALQAGSRQERTLVLYNDDYRGTKLTVQVRLASGDKTHAEAKREYALPPGEHQDLPLRFETPPVPGTLEEMLAVFKDGQIRFSEIKSFRVVGEAAEGKPAPAVELGELASGEPASTNRTTVHPREIDDPLVNPYCGWGLWAGLRFFDSRPFSVEYNTTGFGDDAPLFSWVLMDWMWSDLEPKEGLFDWRDLDVMVDYWQARGKQLVVRLWVTTDPGWAGAPGNKACPDWLWDAGAKYHDYKAEGGVKQKCPAYADPTWESVYLPKMKRLLTAYRDRYHKPGSPIVLDYVMGFGDWGEWHTMWSHYPWPSREKKREVLGKAIAAYLDVFASHEPEAEPVRNLAICHVYDDDCGGEVPLAEAMRRQGLDIAAARGFAFARNGFIDGLSGWPNDLMLTYWRDHQIIAEGNWSYEQVKKDKTHGSMAEHVDAFIKFHATYAHLYMHAASYRQAMEEDRGEHERALKPGGIGYRFVLTSASWETNCHPGQRLTLRQNWVNRNASWCVYPYRLKLWLVDSRGNDAWSGADQAFDPRSWLQGSTYSVTSQFPLPDTLKPGVYELRIALVDESGKPSVRLAVAGADEALRYQLGTLTASEPTYSGR